MTIDLETRAPAPRQDNQDPAIFGQTPSQTVGPFFHYGLPWKGGADLVGTSDMGARPDLFGPDHYVLARSSRSGTPAGEVIEIVGDVRDANGDVILDAMIEIWQADATGRYPGGPEGEPDPHFVGFGRASIDADGLYRFRTVRPGRVPGPGNTLQASHIAVSVFGRGVLKRLATRLYFDGDEGHDEDPVLQAVPAGRRETLIAARDAEGRWRFDIALGGDRETVFFDL